MPTNITDLVRKYFSAYQSKDRGFIEDMLADGDRAFILYAAEPASGGFTRATGAGFDQLASLPG